MIVHYISESKTDDEFEPELMNLQNTHLVIRSGYSAGKGS
jgi:hypothetical protein